jgi:Flp pilus assembly protein TadG
MLSIIRTRRMKLKLVTDGDLPLPEVMRVPVSFETGEQAVLKLYFPYAATITKFRGQVIKAIAGTDDGTVTAANSVGNMTSGVLTFTASDAINTEVTPAVPTTNVSIAKDSYLQLTIAKSTVGGKGLVSVEFIRAA